MVRLKTNNKGFTLIELIIVMMVIGILVLLAVPRFGDFRNKAKLSQIQNDLKTIENLIAVDIADHINEDRGPEHYKHGGHTTTDIKYLVDRTGKPLDFTKKRQGELKPFNMDYENNADVKTILDNSGTKLEKKKFYIIYESDSSNSKLIGSNFKVAYYANTALGDKWFKDNKVEYE